MLGEYFMMLYGKFIIDNFKVIVNNFNFVVHSWAVEE